MWAVLGSNQRPLRCKRRSTQVSWQRRCGISQVISLIRHHRRLPSMAADCPGPRSSRGPDGQRSSRISIRGGDIVKRGNARQLLINDIRLREQTYLRTRGWRARTRIYLSRAFHGLATERQQSLAPPNSPPRICAERSTEDCSWFIPIPLSRDRRSRSRERPPSDVRPGSVRNRDGE
jgi:hypothetical protein